MSPKFSFVSAVEQVFGSLAGSIAGRPDSAEDRLARRAANDAEQR
jgi:hypothetical protein